jgi:dihydrofolate reductase
VSFAIIVAADEANGIGKDGRLPWHLPGDMAFFKRTTSEAPAGEQNVVIMGRKTYESIPKKFRPLAGRANVVISRSLPYGSHGGALLARSLDEALHNVGALQNAHRTFVIGGGAVYNEAVAHSECAEVLLTRVHARFDCDTYFPALDAAFELTSSNGPQRDGDVSYTFETYTRRR